MKLRNKKYFNVLLTPNNQGAFAKKMDWQKWEKNIVENVHILQPQVVEKPHIPTVCLDTNVVISLTALENPWIGSRGKLWDLNLKKVQALQKLIDEKKINAVVTPYVLQELYLGCSKYGKCSLQYLQDHNIFVLDIPKEKDIYYFEDVENTALRYCGRNKNPYAPNPREGRNKEDKIFNLDYEDRIRRPHIKARIVAEASLLGCSLITQDGKSYYHDFKDLQIAKINKDLRLGDCKPFGLNSFVSLVDLDYYKFPTAQGRYKNYIKPAKELEL